MESIHYTYYRNANFPYLANSSDSWDITQAGKPRGESFHHKNIKYSTSPQKVSTKRLQNSMDIKNSSMNMLYPDINISYQKSLNMNTKSHFNEYKQSPNKGKGRISTDYAVPSATSIRNKNVIYNYYKNLIVRKSVV